MYKGRVINGNLKRRIIQIPRSTITRATSDIIKQSIFNVLLNKFYVNFTEMAVIDLFAGSGALGIEAISLGCKRVLFIDSDFNAIKCINDNLRVLDVCDYAKVICQKSETISDDAFLRFIERNENILVFMDPPYEKKSLLQNQILRFKKLFEGQRTIFVIETDSEVDTGVSLITRTIQHGNTFITIVKY
jgi:16S rRNA (guanine966-N2)-methyltransferase